MDALERIYMDVVWRLYFGPPAPPPAPAVVWGSVWDASGGPVAGARVTLVRGRWDRTYSVSASDGLLRDDRRRETTTAGDGSYRFDDVQPAVHTLHLDTRDPASPFVEGLPLELRPGESRRLDFGAPFPWPTLRGTLVTRSGAPAREAGVRASGRDVPGLRTEAAVAADGSFEMRLPPGRYTLAARLAPGEDFRFELGELELLDADARRDFRLGGTRLTGLVRRLDRGAVLAGTDRYEELWLRSVDDDALFRRTFVDRDGRFALEALEPGTYLLDGFPLPVATGVGSLRIDVLPGAVELEVEVGVRAP
jgi:hypothetical protein